MYQDKKILATVCARGGSRGVPRKNIRPLGGLPLILHTLREAKRSTYLDAVVVSTDCEEIRSTVQDYGVKVPFLRPAELAGDKVGRTDAVRHALAQQELLDKVSYDVIVDLGVATPLKRSDDIDRCIERLVDSGASNVFTVCPAHRNPYYNMVQVQGGQVTLVSAVDKTLTDRRDAPVVYDMNDGVLAWSRESLMAEQPVINPSSQIHVMPSWRSIDIDEEIDFLIAEAIAEKMNQTPLTS